MRVERCLIDNGWGKAENLVSRFCRESPRAALVMPSKGFGLGARDTPFAERAKKDGIVAGHHWQLRKPDRRSIRHVAIDTNRWKSLVHERLRSPLGSPDTITLHTPGTTPGSASSGGSGGASGGHRMLIDHLTAERPTQTEAGGRTLETWTAISNRDNDWLDCLVGCAVAASTLGTSAGLRRRGLCRPDLHPYRAAALPMRRLRTVADRPACGEPREKRLQNRITALDSHLLHIA